jgi:hypothetical protein
VNGGAVGHGSNMTPSRSGSRLDPADRPAGAACRCEGPPLGCYWMPRKNSPRSPTINTLLDLATQTPQSLRFNTKWQRRGDRPAARHVRTVRRAAMIWSLWPSLSHGLPHKKLTAAGDPAAASHLLPSETAA